MTRLLQINYYFIIILFLSDFLYSQIPYSIPHYEPFEPTTFSACFNHDCEWQKQVEDFSRTQFSTIDSNYSNSLRLDVKDGDFVGDQRDRSEIAMWQNFYKTENNSEYYYSWDLYIPYQEFVPDLKETEHYYFILQWQPSDMGYTQFPEPDFQARFSSVQIKLEPNSGSELSKKDLSINFGTKYAWCGAPSAGKYVGDPYVFGYKSFQIKDAVELGKWNHIVTRIKWSYKQDSEMQIWINEKPVVSTGQHNSKVYCNPEVLYLGNNEDEAFNMTDVSLHYRKTDINGDFILNPNGDFEYIPNTLKMGHYRKNYLSENTLYLDNLRITTEYPPAPFTTSLTDKSCGKTFSPQYEYYLNAYEISPAESYLFQFENRITHDTIEVTRDVPLLDLLEINGDFAGKTFEVQVRALNNENNKKGFDFGKTCTITLSGETRLDDNYSGNNSSSPYLVKRNEAVSNFPVPGATEYLYGFSEVGNPSKVFWIPGNGKDINSIIPSRISILNPNSTYELHIKPVRWENGENAYKSLETKNSDFVRLKKKVKKLDDKFEIEILEAENLITVNSKFDLNNVYLLAEKGEILEKLDVELKQISIDINKFRENLYQIVVIDKKGNLVVKFR